jgi:hypothetical protein
VADRQPVDLVAPIELHRPGIGALPLGFCICTVTLAIAATSAAVTGAVHSVPELHIVVRAVPPISSVDPGPGLAAAKPLPSTRGVKPSALPAPSSTCKSLLIVTFAEADFVASTWLVAATTTLAGPPVPYTRRQP